jgi:N-acylneuraminate cytidylyltransferase/CMP-N,N'-diacetyllegionaminic acid synthase
MYEGKSYLGLIPARGGSKGLPGKNIKVLGDKPLIAWSVMAAKQSLFIDRVVVTTDDMAIMDTAQAYGADVPFMRPKELATDSAKMMDVIEHTYRWFSEHDKKYDYVVLLQPTSPFRTARHIDEAIELLYKRRAKVVLGVTALEHSPLLANKLPADGNMNNFYASSLQTLNRQEMDTYYRLNGGIYVADFEYLVKNRVWIGADTYAYIMDKKASVDIDHMEDFLFAQTLLANNL